tara:strand:+ start:7993 stop:8985 length:993 start_codon:yes stop_codon:yes gene_type:complete
MANNRIFYATQAVSIVPKDDDGTEFSSQYAAQGVQSVGLTTNYNLEQVFQLGQLEIYDQVEDIPEVEMTINKNIDGSAPLYLLCMGGSAGIAGASGKTLPALANNKMDAFLTVYPDTASAASGAYEKGAKMTDMYLSSVSFTFPVDGISTEDVTLVGNAKTWGDTDPAFTNQYGSKTAPRVAQRYSIDVSSLPYSSRVQSVTMSTDFGREAINELGTMKPYYRYVNFPVEVTCEIEVIALDGDGVEAADATTCNTRLNNVGTGDTIAITVCGETAGDSLTVNLGTKNKISSVNYSGGDTGGGNASITYSYQTFNDFIVTGAGTFGECPVV